MKFLKYFLYFLISLYFLFCIGLYFGQERLLFLPSDLPESYRPSKGQEVWIPVEEDVKLHAVEITIPQPKGVILYLHGNKGNVQRCVRQSGQFQNLGYDVLIPDYRAYGKSEGELENETQMYHDVQKIYDYLSSRYDEIIILGYSMGSGMASYLAANNPCKGLVLVAPYVSLVDMKNRFIPFVPNFLLKYSFRTDEHLKKVKCPVTLIHGTRDEVIPYESSLTLKEQFPGVSLITLQGAGHRRVIFDAAIRTAVMEKL